MSESDEIRPDYTDAEPDLETSIVPVPECMSEPSVAKTIMSWFVGPQLT